jgi:hypothetical protein
MSCRSRWTGPVSPVTSMPRSDWVKMRFLMDSVLAVMVTSGGGYAWRPFVSLLFGGDPDWGAGCQAEVAHGLAVGDGDRVEAQVKLGSQVERHALGAL